MASATVNGEIRTFEKPTTIAELIRDLGFSGKPVAVEINQRIVSRDNHDAQTVQENDVIEIVTVVGGG